MKNPKHNRTAAPVMPVIPRVDAPTADVVILETLYRNMGMDACPAIAAAWRDYAMFNSGPPGPPEERR